MYITLNSLVGISSVLHASSLHVRVCACVHLEVHTFAHKIQHCQSLDVARSNVSRV